MRGEIIIDDVVEWYYMPILGFDAVRIILANGACVQWLDWDESLIHTLKQRAGPKERKGTA